VPYDTVTFKKDVLREGFLECEIPKEWIERQPLVYFAISLAKTAEEVAELVRWGVKLVSGADIERVLQGVVPGIALTFERMPPTSFPKRPDLHFFFIETEGNSRETWLNVMSARSAVLLSTLGFLGDIQYHLYVELRG
jgi:predicted component of type VI protein secretion system